MIYDKATQQLDPPITEVLKDVCVLFADDNEDTLDILRIYSDAFGWNGKFVTSATEILEAINQNCIESITPFDAIVADVNYFKTEPNITGITAAREIRKAKPDVPIVFVSAYSNSIIREEVRRVHAEFVSKPVDPKVLFDMLSLLIYWHRLSLSQGYKGIDRRRKSVNLTDNLRRGTDKQLSSPQIITDTINSLRSKSNEG